MADNSLGKTLDTLLRAEAARGTVRLHLEPVLKGYPFPEKAGGPEAQAGAEPTRYDGALYVYDDALLKRLSDQHLIRSIKSGVTEGVDYDGKRCRKVYLQRPVLDQYLQLVGAARKEFEENAGVELLALNPSSEVAMAVAKMEPSQRLTPEHNHALIVRVLDQTPPKDGYTLLREAGLMKRSGERTRVPHLIDHYQGPDEEIKHDEEKAIYTYVIPITAPIAQAILRCDANRCVDWIGEAGKRMGLSGHETMDRLLEEAVMAPELQGMYSSRMPPEARAAAAARKSGADPRAAAKVVAAEVATSDLPPLSSFREELKGLLRSDSMHRTTQPMINGGVSQVIRIKGDANQAILRRLLKDQRQDRVRDPLIAGQLRTQREGDITCHYFSTTDGEIKRLAQVMGVADFPSCKPLPIQMPDDPFRPSFSGDYGRPMGISKVFLHQQGTDYVMYAASDSAVRLKQLADRFNIQKDSPRRSWITSEDETPSVMRLVIPAEAFEALKKEKIRSADARRRGESTPPDQFPEVLDTTSSRADVEAHIRGQFNIKDRSKPAPVEAKGEQVKAPKIGPEEGIPKLKDLLREQLARELPKDDGKSGGSNMPTFMYRACLAKVRRKDRASGEYVTASELYIRGSNNHLRAMVGKLRKELGWPDDSQIRFEVGKGLEGALPGLVSVTLPDVLPNDAWSQIQREFAGNIDTVTPEGLGVEGAKDDAQAFQNSGQMKRELTRYFDSFQRFGKYISPEELALSNLKGKAVRVVTITKPNESALRTLDEEIGKIRTSLGVLKETAERLHDHAALVALEDKGAAGRKGRKRKAITQMDGVGPILRGAAEGATRAGQSQEAAVRRLQSEVGKLHASRQTIEQQGRRQEIVILDPDHETESLLREAKEIVIGPIHHDGKALRFTPAPDLMETLRSRNMRPDRLRADPVPEGEIGMVVERALERLKRKQTEAAERAEGAAPMPTSQRTVKAHAVRPVRDIAKLLRPILVYEQAGDRSDPRPILILPLRHHDEGDQAAKLCRKLSQMEWLEQTQWHWLQDTLEEKRAARPMATTTRRANRPAVSDVPETEFESNVKGTIKELAFHVGRLRAEEPQPFHQDAFRSHLRDLISLLRDGEQARGGAVEAMRQRELIALFNDQGLRAALDRWAAAGEGAALPADVATSLYQQLRDTERAIGSLQQQATGSVLPEASDTVTVLGRRQPYPLDAEVMPDHDPFVYSDALGQMARDMAGAGHKTPALKVYLSDMGATAFTEWAKECGVDVVTERTYAPHELVDFASRKLSESGHRAQQVSGGGRQTG